MLASLESEVESVATWAGVVRMVALRRPVQVSLDGGDEMRILGRYVLTLAMIGVLSAVTSPDWRPRSVVAWLGVAPVVVLTYFTAEWAWEAIVSPQRGYRISQAAFSGARILVALVLMLPIVATAVAVRVLFGGAQ